MNKMKQKNRIYFFFSLIFTLLITSCGIKNYKGFVEEDARFANYTFLDYDNAGLAYYVDETNPNDIAVGIGTCTAENVNVSVYTEEIDGVPTNRNVTSVFPSGFQNCNTIKKITLPDTVTTFGTDAFAGSSLETITIPKNLTAISSGAFRNCKDLTSVKFKTGNLLATINDYAFANCYNLATFPFHEITNLTTVGREAFLYCLALTSVVFPDGFATLESYAFQDCKNLTTIYFPGSITFIGASAFRGVGQTARIYFSEDRPTTVADCSFSDPDYYSGISAPFEDEHNFSFGDYHIPIKFGVGAMRFDGDFQFITPDNGIYDLVICNANKDETKWQATKNAQYHEYIAADEVLLMGYTGEDPNVDLDIPATILGGAYKVVGIMNEVFLNKTNIKSVTFHENLRFIDYGAFNGCSSLTNIDLSGAVDLQHIQSRAFYNTMPSSGNKNDQLYSIHIPSNVENIEGDAFRNCEGLFRLYFDGATNEYEEAFVCPANGSFSFDLAYQPLSISSITFDGPKVNANNYTISGKTVTLSSGRQAGVARVKYTTNSTTTQTLTGYEDDNGNAVSEFVLAAKTDADSIGSVTVSHKEGGATVINSLAPEDYSITAFGEKSKITFTSAPEDGDEIVISYRAQSKLTQIKTCAFYNCANGFGTKSFYNDNGSTKIANELRQLDDPFSNIYFPASLTDIGEYAFSSGQFIGGVTFSSSSLYIRKYAFNEQKALSSIVFPNTMTKLELYEKCFANGLSSVQCSASVNYKKLISVTLPSSTAVKGTYIFSGHLYLAIYCIGNLPSGASSTGNWNRLADKAITTYGSFSSAATNYSTELDWAPVYTVSDASDIVSLPNKEHPIFDFVRESGDLVTLASYHYYGGRIKDQDGDTAIVPGSSLSGNNLSYKNSNYNSQYAVLMDNGHFRFEVPCQVLFGEDDWLDVKAIGKGVFALQMVTESMYPKNGAGEGSTSQSADAYKYWQSNENFWTMREVTLPNSIETIADAAMAITPLTTVKSYSASASKESSDTFSRIWKSGEAISAVGGFPSSLKVIGKKAFVFSGITNVKLPSTLEVFGNVTSSGPDQGTAYYYFPFMGCFDLAELSIDSNNAIFTSAGSASANAPDETPTEGVLSHKSSGMMIEGAAGKTSVSIPWGTSTMVAGALRGGRKIKSVTFPYTLTGISNNFLDTIGDSRDSLGRSGLSDLTTVEFGDKSKYPDAVDPNPEQVPLCTSIGKSAFYGAGKLKTFEFPVNVTSLGETAFIKCSSLDTIKVNKGVADGVETLGDHLDFTKLPSLNSIANRCFESCTKIKQVTTSSALKSLGTSNFAKCSGITTLNLHSETKTIGGSCFSSCTALASVSFNTPSGNTLDGSCFSSCTSLTSVTFNGTQNSIGTSSFSSCTKLETVTFTDQNATAATFNDNTYDNCSKLQSIRIPSGSHLKKKVFNKCTSLKTGGVIVGAGSDFSGTGSDSAFASCDATTKIFLMDNETAYIAAQTGTDARYPSGWNFYNSTTPLSSIYIYSESNPESGNSNWGYWHLDANNQPAIWREKL